jgi:acetyltransferase-like isoleucine patch superfamily enzyme
MGESLSQLLGRWPSDDYGWKVFASPDELAQLIAACPGLQLGTEGPVRLEERVVLAHPVYRKKAGEALLILGGDCHIRSGTVIYAGTTIGPGLQTGHHAVIREGNVIGKNAKIGTNTEIAPGCRIGDETRIHTNCFLEEVTLGSHVFIAPGVNFLDDPHPACPKYKECLRGAVIEDYVRIGGGVTITPGARIGRNSLVGAGAVVVHDRHKQYDIEPNSVAAGNPAKRIKDISELTCWPGLYAKPYDWEKEAGK